MGERAAADWVIAALVTFMIGRFVGTALMSRFNAARLMATYAAINIVLAVVAVIAPGMTGLVALTALSFFMSIMFPTIFALGVKDLGPYTQTGSSLIVMAIVGGAVLTPAMGAVSTYGSIQLAMMVPAICFAVIGLFALSSVRRAAGPASDAQVVGAA
jgi:FHS family L-fucose permease-like MFS transporter